MLTATRPLALMLGAALAAASPARADPPKPPAVAADNGHDEVGRDGAAAGKKVKTETEKAQNEKTKPKPLDDDQEDGRPGSAGTAGASAGR